MEPPVAPIEFPYARAEIVDAVRVFADPEYQRRVWIRRELPPGVRYDELDYRIHALFDDWVVLPDPERAVGSSLYPDETGPLRTLGEILAPLIRELGDVDDADYLAHPRWPDVVQRAADAYRVMHANDEALGTGGATS